MSEARANVPPVFLDMLIGIERLSVPIVDSVWEALLFPKSQETQNGHTIVHFSDCWSMEHLLLQDQ